MSKPLTIEQRIVVALRDAIKSDAVAELIQEVEVAAQAAAEDATKAHSDALDPAITIDVAKIASAVASATLVRDRLQAALPRLQQRHTEVREAEHAAAWTVDYEQVKAQRDAVAQQLRERYPQLVEELVTLMTSIAATDKEVGRINVAAPCGDYPRLRGVELSARGLDRLLQPDISITHELRLPNFTRGAGEPLLAYPSPEPNLAELYVLPASYLVPVDPQAEAEERERRKLEDNDKMKAFYENQKRVRDEREAAERNRLAVP